ncbi:MULTISPECIES: tRNA 2-thiouridine(34) synthase MnmA [unclassified Colwellia]|uniref:tRNA 2-thiouridine(34) synthase MnmA n=1 Tax=unclassified Colwellia TaxID=196834 RepID=UPI0015F54534|nr:MULTISPECIES: tRNA 2-thiouridine(34) synthase MnmA [unclassified Colwellia]MBA6233521.1 tRNA 2-thiouridine(34) synthase MnmA [Colwellia sp. MB02u-7]MBA6238081.1 tRNA 2-thiouridine(34) synthase MnmA [Colwellia sp. MB02u-11]MBA6257310.1 tRNA 2-thiouridine(34) synthase MnmA [Colwellia sp. MB3u-28]MBA6258894.1 tRNA 2-thiouridine(34) synthase MnmA [Colwellia sp. MB3u-41]MBA6299782.1 tRNA 2-thiouridine(34) synthase MnmA [Colwellia sp. MB3u-22]
MSSQVSSSAESQNSAPKTKAPCDTKVIVGMSGGVDSSVSAHLLIEQGYQVEGLFMKNWEEDDTDEYCAAAQDLEDAQLVCDKLGIKLHTINFATEYWDNVFEYFLAEYKAGRTPNPDIMCNKEIKFKAFLEFACEDLDADYIATGHYVQRKFIDGQWAMLRGLDSNKDQSYFLYTLSDEQVGRTLFPVGNIEKPAVRAIAEQADLITHNKKDSTGICFIGERKFKDFLGQYLPAQPGKIESAEGDVIGEHDGLMYHTLGQRKGLRIGGLANAGEEPWYVVEKDLLRNVLIVGQGHNHPRLFSKGLIGNQLHLVNRKSLDAPVKCTVKTRYRQDDVPCHFSPMSDGEYLVMFDEPQSSVTPGQSVVFYQDNICLGGGIINTLIR